MLTSVMDALTTPTVIVVVGLVTIGVSLCDLVVREVSPGPRPRAEGSGDPAPPSAGATLSRMGAVAMAGIFVVLLALRFYHLTA